MEPAGRDHGMVASGALERACLVRSLVKRWLNTGDNRGSGQNASGATLPGESRCSRELIRHPDEGKAPVLTRMDLLFECRHSTCLFIGIMGVPGLDHHDSRIMLL